MSVAADRRRALLTAALVFLHFAPVTPALVALHAWLDSWRRIGHIVVGMERQGYVVIAQEVTRRRMEQMNTFAERTYLSAEWWFEPRSATTETVGDLAIEAVGDFAMLPRSNHLTVVMRGEK